MGWSKFRFSEHGHVAYQIKENHKCSNMVANILTADLPNPRPWGWGQKVTRNDDYETLCLQPFQNSTLSEHSHVAYQIKGNHIYSNMVANILPVDPPLPPTTLGMGTIGQNSTFHNMVMLHIKLNEITKCSIKV